MIRMIFLNLLYKFAEDSDVLPLIIDYFWYKMSAPEDGAC